MKKLLATTILISILFAFQTDAQGLFLKIGGTGVGGGLEITGEVTSPAKHASEILLGSIQEGTGTGCSLAGDCLPASQSELTVSLSMDKSFIPLRNALLNHTMFNLQVTQVALGADKSIINLDDVMITGISLSSGGDTPSLSISFSSPKWQHTFIPTTGPPIKYGWNFLTNSTYTHP